MSEAKQLLLEVRQNLSTVFGNSVLSKELQQNKDFQPIIEKQVALNKNLEIINKDENTLTQKYAENYKKYTGLNVNFEKYAALTDLDDIQDEINFLNVFTKNIFDKKVSEFAIDVNNNVNLDEGVSPGINGPKVDADKPLKGERVSSNDFGARAAAAGAAATGFGARGDGRHDGESGGFNPNLFAQQTGMDMQDQMFRGLADQRLKIEIAIGKVYRWKEKPRAIIIVQYLAVVFSMVLLLATAGLIIDWIYASSNNLTLDDTKGSPQVISPISFIFSPLVILFVGVYLVIHYFNDSQGKVGSFQRRRLIAAATSFLQDGSIPVKNDNLRYHFQILPIVWGIIFFIVLTFLPFGTVTPLVVLQNIRIFKVNGVADDPIITSLFVMNIVFICSFGPLIFIAILGKLINPIMDVDRLTKILEKYTDEAKTAAAQSGMPPPGFGMGGPFGARGPFGGGF